MFLASIMFGLILAAQSQAQTIIESSAVIATSITALVMALRASNKKKATAKPKPKPRATVTASAARGGAIDAPTIER
jgi:hypothetical protein